MFDRSWGSLSAIAALGVLPLAIAQSGSPLSGSNTANIAVSAQSVRIGVQVATVMHPLDLDVLTSADFGDSEHR